MSDLEFVHRYRPRKLSQIEGNGAAVIALQSMLRSGNRVPHALLLTGPSGCGKTTIARIVKRRLKCGKLDFVELDAGSDGGVGMIRNIKAKARQAAAKNGGNRLTLIDEAHQMTKEAQNGFLKELEEPMRHVYYILATTDPTRLLKTIQTRCTEIKVQPLTPEQTGGLIKDVSKKEGIKLTPALIERIVDCSEGSPRKALVFLYQVSKVKSELARLELVQPSGMRHQAIELCRVLMKANKHQWRDVCGVLKTIDEDPEGIRRLMLAYFASILSKQVNKKAFDVMLAFSEPFYNTGRPGLVLACYAAIMGT